VRKLGCLLMYSQLHCKSAPNGEPLLLFAAILAMMVALMCIAVPAGAQSDEVATPEMSAPPPDEDASSPADADVPAYSEMASPSDDDSAAGQVLELPQQVDAIPQNANASSGANASSAASASSGANGSADANASADDSAESPDQLGSVSDYQNQPDVAEAASIPGGVPVGMIAVPVLQTAGPGFGTVGMLPQSRIIPGPTGLGPFPATSPMLSGPRFGVPMPGRILSGPRGGSIPGGWWTRAHR
jgi:hypothetical protein